jgi:micrococcal nuclease
MKGGRIVLTLSVALSLATYLAFAQDVIGPDGGGRESGGSTSEALIADDPSSLFDRPSEAIVTEVQDGDTIVIGTGEKVRYIGTDSPETKLPKLGVDDYYGKAAAEFNRSLVMGKRVRLVYDEQLRDRYNRLLAYVYIGDTFVNAEMIRQGHALAASFPPNTKYADTFMQLMGEAIDNKRGVWGFSASDIEQHYGAVSTSSSEKKVFTAECIGATDGDTIMLKGGALVRMIGIDSPETFMPKKGTKYYGRDAHDFCNKLVKGKTVRLEYDVQYTDPKKRLLAYVYVGDQFINREMVRNGYAIVAIFPPNVKKIDQLLEAQGEARKSKRGMWSGVSGE